MDRRQLLTLLALGSVAAACERVAATTLPAPGVLPRPAPAPNSPPHPRAPRPVDGTVTPSAEETTALPSYLEPLPTTGPPVVVRELPEAARLADWVALTIDDGFSAETVAAYVDFAVATGTHLTLNPNGVYGRVWDQHADALRPLVESGQVQIGNHTFNHKDLRRLSRHGIEKELQDNEDWVVATFGTTTRPWCRPPFGFRDERTDEVAAELGWTHVLLWNGSFGDAVSLTPDVLLQQAQKWLNPGTIMLGHANHPTVTHLYPQLQALLAQRGLTPVTLAEAFSLVPPGGTGTPSPRASR